MIYFDNAATTLQKPECVKRAVADAIGSFGNDGRGVHDASLNAGRIIYDTRDKLSKLFHGDGPSRVAFTSNSTESLNMAIKGILSPGDHAITTELEHNSVLRPLYEMERAGVELSIIQSNKKGQISYQDMADAVKSNTKAIICTHGSNLTGNLLDLKKVGQIAKKNGLLFVVDASQTAGVFEIDMKDMQIDILCFTGHKGLLGPQGTGGLVVAEGVDVRPLLSGGSGIDTYNKMHPNKMPTALEAGTLNGHGIAGLHAALEYIEDKGMKSIREAELELMWHFYEGVHQIEGVTVYGDFSVRERCPIVTLNIHDFDSSEVSDCLFMDYGIATRPGAHCAPLMHQALGTVEQGAVRFSFSHFNTMREVDIAIEAIKELAQTQD